MALIACKDCGHKVSDQAVACPQCGRPIRPIETHPNEVVVTLAPPEPGTQTIQKTGKKWKGLQLGGCLLVLLGFISCLSFLVTNGADSGKTGETAVSMFVIGVALWFLGKVGGWWFHR